MWQLRIDASSEECRWPAPPIAWLPSFEPRRSRLLSWPVRLAEIADRLAARTLPAPRQARVRDRGLAYATLSGLDACCRLAPGRQASLWAERALVRIRRIIEQHSDACRRFQRIRQAARREPALDRAETIGRLYLNPAHCWMRCDPGPTRASPGPRCFSWMTTSCVACACSWKAKC